MAHVSRLIKNQICLTCHLLKILEEMVSTCGESYFSTQKLHDDFHSAYRGDHSAEAAPLKVRHDIAETLDKK